MRRKLTDSDLERMRIPVRHWGARFDGITARTSDRGWFTLQDIVSRYFQEFEKTASAGFGLLLYGPNGTGKTGIGVVALKEFRRRTFSSMFVEAAEMKSAVFGNEEFDESQSMWDRMRSVDVLLIDDVGKGVQDSTGAFVRLLDELIRHRTSYMRVTWMTTNMSPTQLSEFLKPSTMHAIKEAMVETRVVGQDRREGASADVGRSLVR